jgi:pimeloyl-ACP methyl ester carboxylesterase
LQVPPRFVQVLPVPEEELTFHRRFGQDRAVILIHGFQVPLFHGGGVVKPVFQGWQRPYSLLVEALANDADVYAFAYCQTVAVEEVARCATLVDDLCRVRALGYREVVLVGHSAGGLIARQFVEDHPEAGITKVVQVCAPNAGAAFAEFEAAVPANQRSFVRSLTPEGRLTFLANREQRQVPREVDFTCIVANGAVVGDGVVPIASQWPGDLQKQGIPAVVLDTNHFTVMRTRIGIRAVCTAVRSQHPRLSPDRVTAVRKLLEPHLRIFASP